MQPRFPIERRSLLPDLHRNPAVKPLLILGARPFASDLHDVLEGCPGWDVVGFVENWDRSRAGQTHEGLPIHWVEDIGQFAADHWAICSLCTTHRWKFTKQVEQMNLPFATAVHHTAHVSSRTTLGEGCRIGIGAIVAAHSKLGRHVGVNRGATIGHHTDISDFCTIQPGANVAGHCKIGKCTYVGMGANVLDGVQIGEHCVVGAGAVVTRDLPNRTLAVGVPARIVREGINGK